MRLLLGTTIALGLGHGVFARNWRDIKTIHDASPQHIVNADHFEADAMKIQFPSDRTPTRQPTQSTPVEKPTRPPTPMPTEPTVEGERYPPNDTPRNPARGYFNYDVQATSYFGPGNPALIRTPEDGFQVRYNNNGWAFVQSPEDNYWSEFSDDGHGAWKGVLESRNMDVNQCGNLGMQSPIDVRLSGVACVEHHQIRTRPGDFRVSGSSVDKRIESNKLRLVWQRRPCQDLTDSVCAEPDPPHADYPNGWGGFADVMHVDFKIPAEHRIYGEQFDAEMQIFHLHADRRRLPAHSVLIRARPGGHNSYLQTAIDAFQHEYDNHRAQCGQRVRARRRLVSNFEEKVMSGVQSHDNAEDHGTWADFSTLLDDSSFVKELEEHDRRLSSGIWNPYHESLIPTYWFYGYDGSLTEPPCTEIVTWFVMDKPMIISPEQLEQMKQILFTHVNAECKKTSVHFESSVARPIQESAGRQVWHCSENDFIPDSERDS